GRRFAFPSYAGSGAACSVGLLRPQASSQPEVINRKIDECGQYDCIEAIGARKKPEGPCRCCDDECGEEEGD
ncbi:MAG TPA: hypothetical protein PLI17_08110, partial [Denitromonas sp.]|nr:hypothetical protein [Denitromonas sp.]